MRLKGFLARCKADASFSLAGGMVIGMLIGIAMGNIGVGIALGAGIGLAANARR